MSSILKELSRRTRKDFGPSATLAVPLGSDAVAYTSPNALAVQDGYDDGEMSQLFVVTDSDEDREGDIIYADGCLDFLDEYRRNPVWLLEHNPVEPVGLATDKDGRFHVDVQTNRILAKCFFHRCKLKGDYIGEEVYKLVKAGVFRGASIGFLPIESRKRPGGAGLIFNKWRLTEITITTQPVNQNALRMSLSRGYIQHKSLKRRLESMLLAHAPIVNGSDLSGRGTRDKSMKPKIHTIFCDSDIFPNADAAKLRVQLQGYSTATPIETPGVFAFAQRDGDVIPGSRKSLGKGIWATLTKSKAEDEDEKDDETPDFAKDKVEKADTDDEDTDDTDETDDTAEVPDEAEVAADEGEDNGQDDEESDTEDEAEEPETPANDANPEELKAQAQDLANVIGHFEMLLEHLPDMSERASGAPHAEVYAKLQADAEALIADLDQVFGKNFSGVARQAMVENPETDNSAANTQPDEIAPEEDELVKSLKPAERKALANELKKIGKSFTVATVAA